MTTSVSKDTDRGFTKAMMSRSRSTPLRQYLANAAVAAAASYNLEQYFPSVPDAIEFGSSWSEISDAKTSDGSMLSSSMRSVGGAATSASHTSAAAAPARGAPPPLGGGSKGTFGSLSGKLSQMGPSGANAVGLGVTRRFINVTFFSQLSQVQVVTDDAKVPLTIRVFNRRGEPLQVWDFYVGAVIDILGRPTTLTSASASTQDWLDFNARRLWKSKVFLEERLNKFRAKPKEELENGPFRRLAQPGSALGGSVPLTQLATCVARLEQELKMYQ